MFCYAWDVLVSAIRVLHGPASSSSPPSPNSVCRSNSLERWSARFTFQFIQLFASLFSCLRSPGVDSTLFWDSTYVFRRLRTTFSISTPPASPNNVYSFAKLPCTKISLGCAWSWTVCFILWGTSKFRASPNSVCRFAKLNRMFQFVLWDII